MAITENKYTVVDGIDEEGNIHVKDVTQIMKDGVATEFKSYSRRVVHVGDDIATEDNKVKVAADAMWDTAKLNNKVAKTIAKVAAKRAEVEAAVAALQAAIDEEKLKQAELAALQTPV